MTAKYVWPSSCIGLSAFVRLLSSKRLKKKAFSRWTAFFAVNLLLFTVVPARAATVPGTIHGSFSVNPTGAATYEIPINVPTGVKGLKPKLSLIYNSQHGPGLAGYGWTLSGLSAITRCGKTLAQDGAVQALTFTDGDDYCLDGQKLQPLPSNNGFYRTEIDQASNIGAYYSGGAGPQPQRGPHWFEVQAKDGLIYIYGATTDSAILARGPAFGPTWCGTPTITVIRVWALSEILDRNGNAISFHYAQDTNTCTGDYWPTSITYTDTASVGAIGTTDPVVATGAHTIAFTYDTIGGWPVPPDFSVAYRGGANVGSVARLNGITISYNNTTSFVYGLQYQQDPSTLYSELTSVTECAGSTCTAGTTSPIQCSANCFASSTINWGTSGGTQSGWKSVTPTATPVQAEARYGVVMDAFGDGTEDFVYPFYNSGSVFGWSIFGKDQSDQGFSVWTSIVGIDPTWNSGAPGIPINYYGNGKQSLLQYARGTWHIYTFSRVPGSGTLQVNDHDTTILYTDYGPAPQNTSNRTIVADVNGDGLDDIVIAPINGLGDGQGDYGLIIYLNSPSGISTTPQILYNAGNSVTASNQFFNNFGPVTNGIRAADFDGDGRTDFLIYGGSGNTWTALVSGGTKNAPTMGVYGSLADVDPNYPPLLLDANGDGLTDVVYVCLLSGATTCHGGDLVLAVSSGQGFLVHDTGRSAPSNASDSLVTDYYGNGRQGMMFAYNNEWWFYAPYYDTSTGFYTLGAAFDTGVSTAQLPQPSATNTGLNVVFGADMDGDGLPDLVGVSSSAQLIYALHNANPLKASSITDGLQNSVQLSYQPITYAGSGSVYSPASSGNAYPVEPYDGPLYVISSATANSSANNGDSSVYTDSYTYQGAARDSQGRGFLGFATVQQVDNRLNEMTVTNYGQTFPYIGLVNSQAVYASNGTLQHNAQNTYASIVTLTAPWTTNNPPPVAAFPYVQANTVTSYGSDGDDSMSGQLVKTVKTTSSYDGWENPTVVTTDIDPNTINAYEMVVTSTYSPNASLPVWCLGLPYTVTVAKSFGQATATGTTRLPTGNQSREATYTNDQSFCRATSKTEVAQETGMSLTTTYSFTNPQGVADPNGNVDEVRLTNDKGDVLRDTVYDYSGTNGVFPTTTTRKNLTTGTNLQVTQIWDQSLGVMTSETDVNDSLTTSWAYDGFGRKLSETEPDATSTTFSYDLCSSGGCGSAASYQVTQTHNSSANVAGGWNRTKYDSFGRQIETTKYILGDEKSWTDTQYNAMGLVAAVSAPYTTTAAQYWTSTTYDNQNRPESIVRPDGTGNTQTTKFSYNTGPTGAASPYAVTQTVTVTNPGGAPSSESTTKQYDWGNDVVEATDAYGTIHYYFDAFMQPIEMSDSAGHVTQMTYDSLGHETQLMDPDSGTTIYQYDAVSDVIGQTDANGHMITQLFDTLGRRYQRTEQGTNGNPETSSWAYDSCTKGAGKLCSESRGVGFTKTYGYDGYGRLQTTDTNISGADYVSATNYDVFGRIGSVSYPATPASTDVAPIANAGPNQIVAVNTLVTLSGAASSDPDNGPLPLTYLWSQSSGPVNVGIDGSRVNKVSFTPTVPGNYNIQLVVGDGVLTGATTVSIAAQPPAPASISITPPGSNVAGSYTVTWSGVSGATSYQTYQSTDDVNFNVLPSVSGTSESFSGMAAGSYYYKVTACLNGVCSPFSAVSSVQVIPPGVPSVPSINQSVMFFDATSNFPVLSWNPVTGANSYQVFQSLDGGSFSLLTGGLTSTSLTLNPNGTGTFSYEVVACGIPGCGSASSAVSIVVSDVPSNVSATPNPSNTGNFSLSWYGSYQATSYVIYQAGQKIATVGANSPGTNSYTISGLGNGTYTYAIAGCVGAICSPNSNSVSETVALPPSVPAVPTLAPNPSTTNGLIKITWSNPSGTYTNYSLNESTDGINWIILQSGSNPGGPSPSYTINRAQDGTYYFSVTYCNTSAACATSGVATEIVEWAAPVGAPPYIGLSPITSANGNYVLSWTAPTGVTVTGYKVYATGANGSSYSLLASVSSSTLSYSFNGNSDGTYGYYVAACSNNSCASSVKVSELVLNPPGIPVNVAVSPNPTTTGQFTLSWGAPTGTTSYYIINGNTNGSHTSLLSASFQMSATGNYSYYIQACNASGCSAPSQTVIENVTGTSACHPQPGGGCALVVPADTGMRFATNQSVVDEARVPYSDQGQRAIESGFIALRERLLRQPASLILPGAQAAWQKRWAIAQADTARIGTSPDSAINPGKAAGAEPRDTWEAWERASEEGVYRTTYMGDMSLQERLAEQASDDTPGAAAYRLETASGTTTNYTVDYVYDDHEIMEAVVDDQDPTLIYWQAEAMDAQGHVTGEIYGNNVLTTSVYDPVRGDILGIQSGVTGTEIQNLQYQWDGYGNLHTRTRTSGVPNPSPTETFQYDSINRVTGSTVTGSSVTIAPLSLRYDPTGLIDYKSDVGTYTYNPNCAHCLSTVTPVSGSPVSYTYDSAGNLTASTDGRTMHYTSENQPWTISSGGNSGTFSYDPEGQRYKEYDVTGGVGTTELEIDGDMEILTPDGGSPTYRLMIQAANKTVAIRTIQSNGGVTVDYLHYDHLGSVDSITNASGALVQPMSFDTFGARRDPNTWAPLAAGSSQATITDHGYTDHQELDGLGLIHMEGRVYDPVLGRFMSADPNIPDMYYSQSLDRYAYVNNNPLSNTDPTGFDGDPTTNGNNPDVNLNNIQLYLTSGLSPQQVPTTLSANYTDLNDGLFSITQTNAAGNIDSTNFATSSTTSGTWSSFSREFAPYTTQLGQQGESGSFVDNLEGTAKALWNTAADITQSAYNFYNPLSAFGWGLQIPHGEVGNNQLLGASIAEIVLRLGVIGDVTKVEDFSTIGSTGEIGQRWLAENIGGESQVYFKTSYGQRYVDQLANGIANESKVGYTTLTQGVQLQIYKDAELMESGVVNGVNWHFFKSPVTGLMGPSQPLQDELNKFGIQWEMH